MSERKKSKSLQNGKDLTYLKQSLRKTHPKQEEKSRNFMHKTIDQPKITSAFTSDLKPILHLH
jgi:hypothetical protein